MNNEIEYLRVRKTLDMIITTERVQKICLNFEQISENPLSKDDHLYWYNKSYIEFIKRFSETKENNLMVSTWIERTAYVFSWIPKIPVARLDQESIMKLSELENIFSSCKLWEIKKGAYLGGANCPWHGEMIFGDHKPPVRIFDFIKAANLIMNYNDNRVNLPTTTKLLHFMFPDLFPIFDSNVCQALYGNENTESYSKYHAYVFALQDFLVNSDRKEIFELADKIELPVLRVIDLILFQQGINISQKNT